MIIRLAQHTDISQIVQIHLSAFPGFFLSSLGASFLATYYDCFRRSNSGILLVAESDGHILGFAATAKQCRGFNTQLLKQNLARFTKAAFRLLLHPSTLIRLAKNLTKTNEQIVDDKQYAELYSIGVLATHQGQGIGQLVLQQTEQLLITENIHSLSLTTDQLNNDKTLHFYTKMGFTTLYSFTAYPNRPMFRLIKSI